MRRASLVLVVALVATTAAAVPGSAAGCANVRRSGSWTVTEPDYADLPLDAVQTARYPQLVPGGPPGSALLVTPHRILRSADGLCTWRAVYTLDPTVVTTDPAAGVIGAETEYRMHSAAARFVPGARDPWTAYALVNNDNALTDSASAFFLATGGGQGAWRTAPVVAAIPPGPAAPVVGDAGYGAYVAAAPSDPTVAYAVLGALVTDPDEPGLPGAIFVTRDSGATWTYVGADPAPTAVVRPVVVDPLDPNVIYVPSGPDVDVLTTRGPVVRRTIYAGTGMAVEAVDVVHRPGRPADIVATVPHQAGQVYVYDAVRSVDGGAHWTSARVPVFSTALTMRFVGGGLFLTADGGYFGVTVDSPGAVLLTRWTPGRRGWRTDKAAIPPAKTYAVERMTSVVPGDTARRTFGYTAVERNSAGTALMVGTFQP